MAVNAIRAIASLGVYGIVIAGWASNSKYPFLGGVRSTSQMISYELSLGLAVIPIFLLVGNLRLTEVVQYQIDHGVPKAQAIDEGSVAMDPQSMAELNEDRLRVRQALARMPAKPATVLVLAQLVLIGSLSNFSRSPFASCLRKKVGSTPSKGMQAAGLRKPLRRRSSRPSALPAMAPEAFS